MKNSNAADTNRATDTLIKCLSEYLNEKGKPKIEEICNDNLSSLLTKFYTQINKKKLNNQTDDGEYKNNSLKCM